MVILTRKPSNDSIELWILLSATHFLDDTTYNRLDAYFAKYSST